MNRRGFLSSILIAAAAPAIVRADSLMRIVPRDTTVSLLDPSFGRYPRTATEILEAQARVEQEAAYRMCNPPIVNVRDFGAYGDGVTDDTLAIQFAAEYADKIGANLYVPPGNYKLRPFVLPGNLIVPS